MFVELSKITHSDITLCEKMAEWLLEKLRKSPEWTVKWKVLVVLKHVCRGGRNEFRRTIQRHVEAIKACQSFKAPLDPLRGDEPSRKVKDAAKDALEAAFDTSSAATGGGSGGKMVGVGSGGGGSASGGAGGGASAGPAFPPAYPSGASGEGERERRGADSALGERENDSELEGPCQQRGYD